MTGPRTPSLSRHRLEEIAAHAATAPAPKSNYERWLDDLRANAGIVERVQLVRASDRTKANFAANWDVSTRARGTDPDVEAARAIGADLVLPERADLRREHGVYEIRFSDLPGGGHRQRLVGFAFVKGVTLFLYVLSSAAEQVLEGSGPEAGGNPFVEALRSTVHRLHYTLVRERGPETSLQLFVPAQTRLTRDQAHAALTWRTLRLCNVDLMVDGRRIDAHSADDELVYSIMAGISAKDLQETVKRLFSHKAAILQAGKWYLDPGMLPFTHEPATYMRESGGEQWEEVDKHTIVARPEAGPVLADLVRFALETADEHPSGTVDWRAVARRAGERHGLQSRLAKHRKRGGKPLHETSDDGYQAIRGLFSERYLRGWLEQKIESDNAVPAQAEAQAAIFGSDTAIVRGRDGRHRYQLELDFPAPRIDCPDPRDCTVDWHRTTDGRHKAHGWPIEDRHLERLVDLRQRRSGGPKPGGPRQRRPLIGITGTGSTQGAEQQRLAYRSSSRYVVEVRPLPKDPETAWTDEETVQLATCRCSELHESVGEALQTALLDVEAGHLALHDTAHRNSNSRRRLHERQLRELDVEIAQASTTVRGADLLHARALGDADGDLEHPQVRRAGEAASEAQAQLEELQTRRTELERGLDLQAASESPETARVDLADPATFAIALSRAPAYADRRLNDLAKAHIVPDSVSFVLDDTQAKLWVHWKLDFRVRDVETGRWLVLPLSGKVRNRDRRRADTTQLRHRQAGELYFGQGQTFRDVATTLGVETDKRQRNSHLWHLLHRFLSEHVPSPALRAALIDSPNGAAELRAVAYGLVTGDWSPTHDLDAGDAYVDWILSTYSRSDEQLPHSWGWHWVGTTHDRDRALLGLFDDETRRISLSDAVRRSGIRRNHIVDVARIRRSDSKPAREPLGNIPPRLDRTWLRTDRISDDERYLHPFPCPHGDCSGRQSGQQPLTHALWTPETAADALLCTHCNRTPSLRDVVFPASYLQPWRGRIGPNSSTNGARAHAGTHLDPRYA
jgi:hypothetical protein